MSLDVRHLDLAAIAALLLASALLNLAGCAPPQTLEGTLQVARSSSVPPGYLISTPTVPTHPDKVLTMGLGPPEREVRARTEILDRLERKGPSQGTQVDHDERLVRGVIAWERASMLVTMDPRQRHTQLEQAAQAFRAVAEGHPDALDAWWGILRTLHSPARAFTPDRAWELAEALHATERVLLLDPDNWVAMLDRGVLLFETGDLLAARDQLERVCADARIDPYPGLRAQAWEHLGRTQLAMGEIEQAEHSLRTALDSWRELGGAAPYYRGCPLMSLGEIMLAGGRSDEAKELYTRAARIDAREPEKTLAKAVDNLQADEYARAADVLTLLAEADLSAVGIPADQAEAIRGEADILLVFPALARRDEVEASARFSRAPAGPLATLAGGHLALQRGELTIAKERLERALKALSPDGGLSPVPGQDWYAQRMALLGLGWVAGLQEQHTTALAYHQRITSRSPADPLGIAGEARALLELGRTDQARQLLQRALEARPDHPLLLNTMGVLQVDARDLGAAQRNFERARDLGGSGYTCPLEGLGMVALLNEGQPSDPTLEAKRRELAQLRASEPSDGPTLRPNFVIVVVDSMRDDRLEDPSQRPPALAALAERGTIFEDSTSQSGWTLPALASLLTGRQPPVVEVAKDKIRWIQDDPAPLPLILDHYGYDTAAFWGETAPTIFERFCPGFGLEQRAGGPTTPDRYHAPVVEWIGQAQEPFFALVHNVDLTNEPPGAGMEALRQAGVNTTLPGRPGLEALLAAAERTLDTPAAQQAMVATYDARLRAYDRDLDAMIAALDTRGVAERTVVVITSNHGQDLFEHGLVGHGSILYQSVLQVPLLVVDPAVATTPRTVDAPVQSMDVAPFVLERAGIPAAATIDGRSLLPLLQDPAAPWPERPIVSVASRQGLALRIGERKIVRHALDPVYNGYEPAPGQQPTWPPPTTTQLFDLASDPGELHDLAPDEPSELGAMQDALDRWAEQLHQRTRGGRPEDSLELQQALQDRGYWMHAQGAEQE